MYIIKNKTEPKGKFMPAKTVTITNISKQMIPLDTCPPDGDFYQDTRQINLRSGKSIEIPMSHCRKAQIENLQSRGMLKIK